MRRQTERRIQADGVKLLKALGARVWVYGTTRRRGDHMGTMQTPGAPDVKAFLPPKGGRTWRGLWWEAKAPGGWLRPDQAAFQELALAAGEAHIVGGLEALVGWLVGEGYLRADQVAFYYTRVPIGGEGAR